MIKQEQITEIKTISKRYCDDCGKLRQIKNRITSDGTDVDSSTQPTAHSSADIAANPMLAAAFFGGRAKQVKMINKNEIRVGNWVSKDGKEYQVTTNTAEIIERGAVLEPIPLTLDWLSKFGFYIVNHIYGYSFFAHKKYKIDVYKEKTTWMGYSIKKCDFVHEMQNAIFTLIGEDVA